MAKTEKSESPKVLRWSGVLDIVRNGNVKPPRRVEKSDAQWRAQLTEEQYMVTRQQATERPFSSEMCGVFEPGRYHCVCCDTPLFDATMKFESGTGWPSFTAPLSPDVVAYHLDTSHGMQRIENTCNVCDAHLGHVFPDGPPPTGLRFCINALSLRKAKTSEPAT
jgi:peptide-methionine (R)-S-oxide reductase